MPYIGPDPFPLAIRNYTRGTLGSATDTLGVAGGYTPNNLEIFINGTYTPPEDYDDSNGVNVIFNEILPVGTHYTIKEIKAYEVANVPSLSGGASADFAVMPQVNSDPIVESGSNSDGDWTRWADGTQICHTSVAGSTGGTISVGGSNYRGNIVWNFPIAFIEPPTCDSIADSVVRWGGRSGSATNNDVSLTHFGGASSPTSTDIGGVAYGRWK